MKKRDRRQITPYCAGLPAMVGKERENINWEEIAKNLLEQEKLAKRYNNPEPISAIIIWKGNGYIGSIQEIVPGFSKEIVLLSKSSYPLDTKLIGAIKNLDKERLELYAADAIDLEGIQHVLRRLDNKLIYMTEEQTIYMTEHLPNIIEI